MWDFVDGWEQQSCSRDVSVVRITIKESYQNHHYIFAQSDLVELEAGSVWCAWKG